MTRFWMQPGLLEALFTARGAAEVLAFVPSSLRGGAALGCVVVACLVSWAGRHWREMDQGGNRIVGEFALEVRH